MKAEDKDISELPVMISLAGAIDEISQKQNCSNQVSLILIKNNYIRHSYIFSEFWYALDPIEVNPSRSSLRLQSGAIIFIHCCDNSDILYRYCGMEYSGIYIDKNFNKISIDYIKTRCRSKSSYQSVIRRI